MNILLLCNRIAQIFQVRILMIADSVLQNLLNINSNAGIKRINMTVRDTSRLSFEEKRKNLGPDQDAVFSILEEIGPADDKGIHEALNQKEQKTLKPKKLRRIWGINEISPRRGELHNLRLIKDLGVFKHHERKRQVHLWCISGDNRQPVSSWIKQPNNRKPVKLPCINKTKKKDYTKTGISSEPAFIDKNGRAKRTISKGQMILFA